MLRVYEWIFLQDAACENIESPDILLSNNLFVNPDNTQNPWIRLVSGYNVTITHNTVFAPNRIFEGISYGPSRNATIRDNIFRPGWAFSPCFDGPGPCWPGAVASHNLLVNNTNLQKEWIDQFFLSFGSGAGWVENSLAGVGFTSPSANLDITGNYRLGPNSPYRAGGPRQASDGKDVGL